MPRLCERNESVISTRAKIVIVAVAIAILVALMMSASQQPDRIANPGTAER